MLILHILSGHGIYLEDTKDRKIMDFHGASLDAISIGGEAPFRKDVGPLLPGTEHIPLPTLSQCLFNCTDDEH